MPRLISTFDLSRKAERWSWIDFSYFKCPLFWGICLSFSYVSKNHFVFFLNSSSEAMYFVDINIFDWSFADKNLDFLVDRFRHLAFSSNRYYCLLSMIFYTCVSICRKCFLRRNCWVKRQILAILVNNDKLSFSSLKTETVSTLAPKCHTLGCMSI